MGASEPFGLYVHWPFCLSKCPYCDFNSHVAGTVDSDEWRRAYGAEMEYFAHGINPRPITSLFFGGGTPSLMDPALVGAVIEAADRLFGLAPDAEITLEANPGAVEAGRFRGYRAAGVNRLSIGVQALDDDALLALGRRHGVAEALAALDLARSVFPRFSLDLIYARPGQSPAAWETELRRALHLAGEHLSLYQLTIEDGTPFAALHRRGELITPPEDDAALMFEITQALCREAGLPAYEVSNHAAPGAACRHNLLYWRGGDWLGIGPGAHGRIKDAAGAVWAIRQKRAPRDWLRAVARIGHGMEERTQLDPDEYRAELVMMGLRLRQGIESGHFARRAGTALAAALDPTGLARMQEGGFVAWEGSHLRATETGWPLLNSLIAALLPA